MATFQEIIQIISTAVSVLSAGAAFWQANKTWKGNVRNIFLNNKIKKLGKLFEKEYLIMHSKQFPPTKEEQEKFDIQEIKKDAAKKYEAIKVFVQFYFQIRHLLSKNRRLSVDYSYNKLLESRYKSSLLSSIDDLDYKNINLIMDKFIFELYQACLDEIQESSGRLVKDVI